MIISDKLRAMGRDAETALGEVFKKLDDIATVNTERVLDVFREERVSESMFAASTGYGYGDMGRDSIDRIAARIFGTEAAFMRPSILCGTHALTVGLFGLLRPGDTLLSLTASPYDTLREVIGIEGEAGNGSLADYGVSYAQVELLDGGLDYDAIAEAVEKHRDTLKVAFIQRSKGYLNRKTLTVEEIERAAALVKKTAGDKVFVVVDNCYGEFTESREPVGCGVDMIIGSLIKNAGGGMADTGGYIAGTARAVELAGYRLSCPGVGLELGASLGQNRNMLKGLFYAPHTVAEALKTAHFAAYVFEKLGYTVSPSPFEMRSDIIQTIQLGSGDALVKFCQGIQSASPVDAFVSPEAWDMPGYNDPVVMAAGAFVGGASIELSADGPIRPPYIAFLQGGLTFQSGKLGILAAAQKCLGE